jgi:hypothetical protein
MCTRSCLASEPLLLAFNCVKISPVFFFPFFSFLFCFLMFRCFAEERTLAHLCLSHKDALRELDQSMRSHCITPTIADSKMLQSLQFGTLPSFFTQTLPSFNKFNLRNNLSQRRGEQRSTSVDATQGGIAGSPSPHNIASPNGSPGKWDSAARFCGASQGSLEQVRAI